MRSFQFENDLWPMQLGEVDGINFFGEMERLAMVDGAALISPEYEQYTAGGLLNLLRTTTTMPTV